MAKPLVALHHATPASPPVPQKAMPKARAARVACRSAPMAAQASPKPVAVGASTGMIPRPGYALRGSLRTCAPRLALPKGGLASAHVPELPQEDSRGSLLPPRRLAPPMPEQDVATDGRVTPEWTPYLRWKSKHVLLPHRQRQAEAAAQAQAGSAPVVPKDSAIPNQDVAREDDRVPPEWTPYLRWKSKHVLLPHRQAQA